MGIPIPPKVPNMTDKEYLEVLKSFKKLHWKCYIPNILKKNKR